ncbi:MAG: sphingomyelin phosphodiesterase [Actinomycetota bacterium]|nr:sphingomyelin phosphodiesterase [Actinomycetota bacterium]
MRMQIFFTFVVVATLMSPQAATAAPIRTDSPKIAAYNVFMLPRTLYPNWGQMTRADLIDQQNVLAGQDVVVLNELFDNESGDRLLRNLADSHPHRTPVVGRSRTGWAATTGAYSDVAPEDGGTAIVSKWPITRATQHVFNESCGVETQSNKGFAYAKLDSPNGSVHVIGVHAQAEDPSCTVSPASVRAAQRAEITQFVVDTRIPAAEPVYIAGDMNVIGDSAEYSTMLRSLGAKTPVLNGNPHSWDCPNNSVCRGQYGDDYAAEHLDYVLSLEGHAGPNTLVNETRAVKSPTWKVTSWFTTYTYNDYSDHYPVFAYAG